MNLEVPGIRFTKRAERGAAVEWRFTVTEQDAEAALKRLVAQLPEGGEISVLEAGGAECYRECQRAKGSLQVKRGCHGAAGTWRTATAEEVLSWLLPGIQLSSANPHREQGTIRVPLA